VGAGRLVEQCAVAPAAFTALPRRRLALPVKRNQVKFP
jgi:hypothetical protein